MAKVYELKRIIRDEALNPDYYKMEAKAIADEFEKEYTDPNYVIEKVRHLTNLAYYVCREELGRSSPEVDECVKRKLGLKD